MKTCYKCFKTYDDEYYICPECGCVEITEPVEPVYLRPGKIIHDRYIIGASIGAGGFGVVYRALDMKLDTIVAVKEFFSTTLCTRAANGSDVAVYTKKKEEYEYRKNRFLLEARTMAKFGTHKNIPNVFEVFEENNTVYIVMELLVGEQLSDYIKQIPSGKVNVDFAILVANEVGNALKSMHEAKIIHRDVAPDNIFICSGKDIQIKLMDLGAAKIEDSSDDVIDLCMKVGYSPVEQYDKIENFGPWSDIYALGATMYHMLTGTKPSESTSRKKADNLEPVNKINPDVSENLNNTIMKAMAINANERFSNIPSFLSALNGEKKVLSLDKENKKRKIKRLCGIAAAIVVLLCASLFSYNKYKEKRLNKYLNKADICVWYLTGSDNMLEEQALNTVKDSFASQDEYGEVTVNMVSFSDKEEYIEKLKQAAEKEDLPEIFEYVDGIDEIVFDKVLDEKQIIKESVGNCSILENYLNNDNICKRIPMAIEIPMAYVKTKGQNAVRTYSEYFNSVNSFDDYNVALFTDDANQILIKLCTDLYTKADETNIMEYSVLLSTNAYYNRIKELLSDEWFAISPSFLDNDKIYCSYTYYWCISEATKDEVNAAEHFVLWMLGANAQTNLLSSTGLLPVNDKAFNKKIDDDKFWNPVKDIYIKFNFEE